MPTLPDPQPVAAYVRDGAYIVAILLVWGVFAAILRFGVGDLGLPFERLWLQLGNVFVVAGLLNAVLYLLYRTVDYWAETP